jgi:hypothetical protein
MSCARSLWAGAELAAPTRDCDQIKLNLKVTSFLIIVLLMSPDLQPEGVRA